MLWILLLLLGSVTAEVSCRDGRERLVIGYNYYNQSIAAPYNSVLVQEKYTSGCETPLNGLDAAGSFASGRCGGIYRSPSDGWAIPGNLILGSCTNSTNATITSIASNTTQLSFFGTATNTSRMILAQRDGTTTDSGSVMARVYMGTIARIDGIASEAFSSTAYGSSVRVYYTSGGSEAFRIDAAGRLSLGGATNPLTSSKMTVTATRRGTVYPRMNSTQREAIVSPVHGDEVYDTTVKKYFVYQNDAWRPYITSGNVEVWGDSSTDLIASAGVTTLTADTYYRDVVLNGTAQLCTAGFRLFVTRKLDLTNATVDAIYSNAVNNTGSNGFGNGTGGAGAAINSAGSFSASATPGTGANGGAVNGSSPPNAGGALIGMGGAAGAGAAGGRGPTGTTGGGITGSFAPTSPPIMRFPKHYLLRGASLPSGGAGSSAGSGGGGDGTPGGGGGGGACGGNILWIKAKKIIFGPSTPASVISNRGGNGGSGGTPTGGNRGGGGGAGGAGGGYAHIIAGVVSGTAPANWLDVRGGRGGDGGNGTGTGLGGQGGQGGQAGLYMAYRYDIQALYVATTFTSAASTSAAATTTGTTGSTGTTQTITGF